MLLMGDEVRRTQGGNNNAFCQDNEIAWFDWSLVERHADIRRFAKALIGLRMNRDLPTNRLAMTLTELLHEQPIEWHGVRLNEPDWGHASHTLAGTVRLFGNHFLLHFIINAYWEPLDFEVPPLADPRGGWRCCVDTDRAAPNDICGWHDAPLLVGATCRVEPRSTVLLFAGVEPARPA
jgi:glycogen operon protein